MAKLGPTEFVYFQGKAKWFRHTAVNEYGDWKHVIYLDDPSLEKMRVLQTEGVKNVIKKDEDGWNISIRRPSSKTYGDRVIGFAPPEVLDKDGVTPLRNVMVGNGSDITTKCEVYRHRTPGGGTAKAMRWLSTRVDNLIPFDGKKDFSEDEARAVKGLADQPEQLF